MIKISVYFSSLPNLEFFKEKLIEIFVQIKQARFLGTDGKIYVFDKLTQTQ
jgi:hypothetical protein